MSYFGLSSVALKHLFAIFASQKFRQRRTANKWCPGADLNHRHADFQSAALPLSYPGAAGHPIARCPEQIGGILPSPKLV